MPIPNAKFGRLWRLVPGLAGILLVAVLAKVGVLLPLIQLEYRLLFSLRGPQPWDERVVVIAIDDASVRQYGRFPWPRQRYADLLNQLDRGYPGVVGIPILFSEASPDDEALAEAMAQQGTVVLAAGWDSQGQLLLPVPELQQAALSIGHVYQQQDSDGLSRSVQPLVQQRPALALAAVQGYALTTAPVELPALDESLWINWPGPVQQLQQYSFAAVAAGQVPAAAFEGKAVLIGVTASAINPLNTPFDQAGPASSVHLHAAMLDNLLQRRFLYRMTGRWLMLGTAVLAMALGAGISDRRIRWQLLTTVLALLVWIGTSVLLFHQAYWLPLAAPALLLGSTGLAACQLRYLQENWLLNRQIKTLWQTYRDGLVIQSQLQGQVDSTVRLGMSVQVARLAAIADQFGRSQSTQAAIARSLSIGLLAADRQGRVWFANPVIQAWLRLRLGDELAQQLVPAWLSAEAWQRLWQRALQGQPAAPYEFFRAHQWFELRLEPILYASGPQRQSPNGFLLTLEDVTHRKQAELALRSLNQTLEQQVRQRTEQLQRLNQNLQQEIEERQQAQEHLAYEACHDSLTGLPNRKQFLQHLAQSLEQLQRSPEQLFAVLFLDCDRFKLINDSFGHWMGDELLKALSKRLRGCIRPADLMARFGGDEFTILLTQLSNLQEAAQVAERIRQRLAEPFQLGQERIFTNASIGIVAGTPAYQQAEEILRDADTAMYQAKTSGQGYAWFESGMHVQVQNSLRLETELRQALERGEFCLAYQPVVTLANGELVGFEALLRWQHPQLGLLGPDIFIALAEETGLIVPLGDWALHQACRQLYQWQQQQQVSPTVWMSVNLSVIQFSQPDLVGRIDQALWQSQLSSTCLTLEITESAIIDNAERVERLFSQLKQRSIRLSIDDFGTGYSSLSYLHRFPVDSLKIDRSFVDRIERDRKQAGIVSTIISLAQQLDMKVIAEGIEHDGQAQCLRQLGCRFGQGYLFSKPLPAIDLQQQQAFLQRPSA